MIKYKTVEVPNLKSPIKGMSNKDYLELLVQNGAKKRYGEHCSGEISERIKYELDMILKYATNYFLMIHEIIKVAYDEFGALIGPGRACAPGSIVNFSLGITQIDPLKYGLLFESFINYNPIRTGVPPIDIDIDIDTESRQELVDWIEKKYGERFAYIATYPENLFMLVKLLCQKKRYQV